MKKIFLSLMCIFMLVGCSIGVSNSPSQAVETYLNRYVNNDDVIMDELDEYVSLETDLTDDQQQTYKEILKRQYSDLTYEITNEEYSGDTAIVSVDITVYDLYKAQNDAEDYLAANNEEFLDEEGNYDSALYTTYKLEQMKSTTQTISYTLEITTSKVDNTWTVEQLSNENLAKIHGIYNYETDNLD